MSCLDKNNIISLNRGDTWSKPLFINQGTDLCPMRYILKDGDEIFFALMEPNEPFEFALVKKKYTSKDLNKYGDVVIKLEHDDTKCLLPGKYYYQIKAKFIREDGTFKVNTIIKQTQFIIEE